ncbi:MAG: filamentous hemagglutinin N-terminal domain-containing protein, partial [Burkholderiales bacterium]|nr:filamentous hemagglutinin N-terminal domain-containing protein [Burkholderiales bacterium]
MNQPSAPLSPSSRAARPVRRARGWRLRPRALALALVAGGAAPSLLPPGTAQALAQSLPSGLQVVHGQASVSTLGNQMTVTNSAGAILNWQSFSVGASQAVRFQQPDAASKVLNRVVGTDPSSILGRLSSNGQVWLINPYGVLFGAHARVDVGSLVVSTLNLADTDWLRQNLVFNGGAGANAATAAIVNQGELRTDNGGRVMLLAGAGGVTNSGLISAPGGQVVLAAGHAVQLVDSGLPNLAVEVAAPAGQAVNLGQVLASGGRVDVLAAMVNQQGIVRADAVQGHGGQVVLRGSEGLDAAAGSLTSASGGVGGQVTLDAGSGTASISGAVQATGSQAGGGRIQLLGRQVGLLDGAAVDASGSGGGGQVLAGGGAQGQDAGVPNAQALYMARGASVRADATGTGDGGHIVLWSDQATRAYGSLSARGGAGGGNGGLVETSGGWLDAQPLAVDTRAPAGRAGTWLLDPYNLSIVDSGSDTTLQSGSTSGGVNYAANGNNSVITTGTIASALNQGLNVTVSTSPVPDYGLQAGDISMIGATLAVGPAVNVTLTLDASRNIVLSGSTIRQDPASGGTFNLAF